MDGGKKLDISVDMYQHQTMTIENTIPLAIWIGSKEHILQQFTTMLGLAGNAEKFKASLKFCPNTAKLEVFLAQQAPKVPESNTAATSASPGATTG